MSVNKDGKKHKCGAKPDNPAQCGRNRNPRSAKPQSSERPVEKEVIAAYIDEIHAERNDHAKYGFAVALEYS